MAAHWCDDQWHDMPADLTDVTRAQIDAMQNEIDRRFAERWPEIQRRFNPDEEATMTGEHAKAIAEMLTTVWENEFPATCAVLGAVKNDNRNYKPDARSRTAWELATHLATTDIWFMDSILNGAFEWNQDAVAKLESSFTSVDDVVAFSKKTFPEKLKALRALPGDKLASNINCFGNFNWPAVQYIGFANNHSIHHRGQLAAYLRPMGSRVPNIYGPSADDKEG
jgi:uncharacterized damage-inducible protein DinB